MIENQMETKERIRKRIWHLLEEQNIADFPRPCFGRIPNFVDSHRACKKIIQLSEFQSSSTVFCAPDYVLKKVREVVLLKGKILTVALPHMKDFVEIDERRNISQATNIKGFKKFGKPLRTKIDLFVQGSVAVDMKGNRLGKGKGYGDKEWDHLYELNLLNRKTKVVTIVHELQIVKDFSHLMDTTDKRVDYILTPERIINCAQAQ